MIRSYILIDTTLLGYPVDKPWIKRRRKPTWVAAIYGRDAIVVSPILIDVERVWHCNRIDAVMALVNATSPQLGISFIETELTLNEVLLLPGLKSVLEQSDPILRQKDLQRLASHHCGGTKR